MDDAWLTCLTRGIDLFNRRLFLEAHDAWEEGWREMKAEEAGQLLQGLIQVAAGFLKLQRSQPRGMLALLEGGTAKLRPLPADRYPVDLEPLLASVDGWRAVARRMLETGAAEYDPESLPRIVLHPPERT